MNIRRATRSGVKPLVAFFSESGCGKTYSALLLARGFAGPSGRIILADSERGRGELYADVIPGGYDVLPIEPPFTPANYIKVIEAIEAEKPAIGILDSGSHEWEGIGGVLDMAATNEERTGKAGLHNWKTPKFEHAKFMLRLMQSTIPWVICLRAKYKSRQTRDERGKTVIVKDEFTSPLQAEDFIFEMTVHGEILADHSFRLTKSSHPALLTCFPKDKPITSEHGKLLAQWCASGTNEKQVGGVVCVKELKAQLWAMTQHIHKGDLKTLEAWMVEKTLLGEGDTLATRTAEQLTHLIDNTRMVL